MENHSQDCRVDVAKDNICPTLTGKMGTGGNNVPLLMESRSTAYGICSMNSNAMKSKNLDSGFYEAQTSRTLDCKGGNPTCNQGGILIVSEKHPVYAIGRDCVSVHKDKAQTLTAELLPGSVAQPLSIGNGQAHSLSMDEKAGTLNCMRDQQAVMVPKAVDTSHADDVVRISDTVSIQARDYKGGKYVFAEYIVRRFTPLECGRLQGFPDGWTDGLSDECPDKKTVQFWLDAWMEWWALVGRAKGIKRPKDEKAVRRWLKDPASDTEIYSVRRGAKGEPEIWREMDVYCRLPDGQKIPEKIVELTGITDQMLAEQGITEDEMAEQFAEIITGEYGKDLFENLKDTLLVAHNAQFDLNFTGYLYILQMAHDKEGPQFRRWLHEFNDADYLDTLTIYKDRAAYPHKLANAIEHYGLQDSVVNSHRAVDDVKALMEVAKAMGRERNDLLNYINIFGYNQKYGVSGRLLKKVSYLQQGFRNEIAPPGQTLPKIHEGGGV